MKTPLFLLMGMVILGCAGKAPKSKPDNVERRLSYNVTSILLPTDITMDEAGTFLKTINDDNVWSPIREKYPGHDPWKNNISIDATTSDPSSKQVSIQIRLRQEGLSKKISDDTLNLAKSLVQKQIDIFFKAR